MNGLELKIFWKDARGNQHSEWAVLNKGQKISMERSSPLFNESGTFSYPFELPYMVNRHIFGNMALPENEFGIDDVEYKFELYCNGLFLFYGDLIVEEGEIEDSISTQLRIGNNSFFDKIKDLNCQEVEQAEKVRVGIWAGWLPISNLTEPYGDKFKFCNIREIFPRIEKTYNLIDTGFEGLIKTEFKVEGVPVIEPDSDAAGICFYVIYLLDCIIKMLNLRLTENAMLNYEDFKRLAFINIRREMQFDASDYEDNKPETMFAVATSKNFPDVTVETVLNALKNAFGIYIVNSEFNSDIKIILIKDVLSNPKNVKANWSVVSEKKSLYRFKKNIVIKYSEGDDDDTAFNYTDFENVKTIQSYNELIDLMNEKGLNPEDTTCYVDLNTGNAYRIKVDSQTYDNPALFEVGQFNKYEINLGKKETEELDIDFVPVVLNDITSEEIRKRHDYKIENAIFFDLELTPRDVGWFDLGPGIVHILGSKDVFRIDPKELSKYGSKFMLGIMRGPGADMTIDPTIDDYVDQIGGNSFVIANGTAATTADNIDLFGRQYDYNGENGGVGSDSVEERFSLKLKATKKDYTANTMPNRGLVDKFLQEYVYFLQNKRLVNMVVDIPLQDMINISWENKYHIGEYSGFINKMSFDIDDNGISLTELELYMI